MGRVRELPVPGWSPARVQEEGLRVIGVGADLFVAVALLGLLLLSLEAGFRVGRRTGRDADVHASGQVGAVQGALLGLLGLLLAFSFGAAGTRFLDRQDLIVREANAIGTASLRADLLDEPQRAELRAALKSYTGHRLAVSASLRAGLDPSVLAEVERLQARIWRAAIAGVAARPAFALAILGPVNEVIDVHALRLAAGRKHLPSLVLGVLIACSALAISVIGYGCGLGGRRRAPMTVPLAFLIAAALWITLDLDHPRAGLLQISDAPLAALEFEGREP
jgi:hypothetical protein